MTVTLWERRQPEHLHILLIIFLALQTAMWLILLWKVVL